MKLIDLAAYAFACTLDDPPPRGYENAANYFKLPVELRDRVQAYLPREIQRLYSPLVITNVIIDAHMCYVYLITDGAYTTILVYEDNQLWMKLNTYNGSPHGKFTIYYDDGSPWYTYYYRFGKITAHKLYFRNGRRACYRKYNENGNELGEIILRSPSGNIITYYYSRRENSVITYVKLIDNSAPAREEYSSIDKTYCAHVETLIGLQ